MTRYAELHARSAFSLLSGASLPERLVERAAELGLAGLALVDLDDVGGVVRFQRAADGVGLHTVVGATVTLVGGAELPVLVESAVGWRRLVRALSDARLECRRGSPRTPLDALGALGEPGLIALTGGPSGPVARRLGEGDLFGARRVLGELVERFGADGVLVEVWDHGQGWERRVVGELLRLARAAGVGWVPTNDVRYATREDRRVLDVMACLSAKVTLDEAGALLAPNAEWHLRSAGAMARRWRGHEGAVAALARTVEVAERCRFDVRELRPRLPELSPGSAGEDDGRLAELVWAGARERWGADGVSVAHRAQLERELGVIGRLGLAGYFLIVQDIVAFMERREILAQGRGSAANSAVCYCLGITAVDPVAMDLLFERFLSEARTDPPDIDIDIAHQDREEVLAYVYERWGRRHAGMVCEQITWRGKSAVRDVARVLGFGVEVGAALAVSVAGCEAGSAAEVLADGGAEAAGLDLGDERVGMLVDVVRRLDRVPRHRSIHVGGFVLTRGRLDEVCVIEAASMAGRTVIQWDKDDLAPVGLVKIDLLGLGVLTMLDRALKLLRERGVDVALRRLPVGDAAVFEMVGRADTVGVFQLESRAQMNALPRLRPERFYDLVVQVALIRPGPIQGQMVHPYIRRRRGQAAGSYVHPKLEPVLARTLGVPVFQEQGMRVAMVLGGLTGAQADRLRKLMGFKRAADHLEGVLGDLWAGMKANGVDEETAVRVVKQLEGFANYGFPESHAASFALLAYASAWVKRHYPAEFLAAILNAQPMGFYSVAVLVDDARRHGVEVRPIDVLVSTWDCSTEPALAGGGDGGGWAVRLGLRLVRGLSTVARDELARVAAEAPLAGLDDLVFRSSLDEGALVALARAGAFRSLWPARREALWRLLGRLRERGSPLVLRGQDDASIKLPALSLLDEVAEDLAYGGATTGPHPMSFYRRWLERQRVLPSNRLPSTPHGTPVRVAGVVVCRQRPASAKGVFFLTLHDEHGMVNVVVMPDRFEAHRQLLLTSPGLLIAGILEQEQGVFNVLAKEFQALPRPDQRARPPPASRVLSAGKRSLYSAAAARAVPT